MFQLHCHQCGAPVPIAEPIPRDSACESCGKDLRACLSCRHYDTSYNNSCTETMADPVVEKDRRNFCEYFYFSREAFGGAAPGPDRAADARAKLAGLFGGAATPSPTGAARKKLDDLFKKPPTQ